MSGNVRKAMAYLGLVEIEPDRPETGWPSSKLPPPAAAIDITDAVAPQASTPDPHLATVRPLIKPTRGKHATVNVRVVELTHFEQAGEVGKLLRDGTPVIMDLRPAETTLARRCVDFMSGVVVVSAANLTVVADRCYLIVPAGVMLSDDERSRLEGMGYKLSGA